MINQHLDPFNFGIDIAFTLVMFLFFCLIYIKTREIYTLSKHKGVQYFRDAFLFFGLSYVLRFALSLVLLLEDVDFSFLYQVFFSSLILCLGYFSTISILYLIFSLCWKSFDNRLLIRSGHIFALTLSILSVVLHSHLLILLSQFILLIVVIVIDLVRTTDQRKISQTKTLYFLVAFLWLVNLMVIGRIRHLHYFASIITELVSLLVVIIIYVRIHKWAR